MRMRNEEYREILERNINSAKEIYKAGQYAVNKSDLIKAVIKAEQLLQEYDRLHPETIQVESVMIRDKRGYKNAPTHMQGCVTLFDNLSGCNITLIDGTLNVEIQ